MARDLIICGLDIGTTAVRAVVAQKRKGSDKLTVIGLGEAPSAGIRKGVVVDVEEALPAIKEAIASAERASGHKIHSVYLGISGSHVSTRASRGIISVSRADQEISRDDVARVIAQAQSISIPLNREILHTLPKEFIVDGEGGIKDPMGMRGLRLETNSLVIDVSAPLIKNVIKCVEALGLDVDGLVLSSLAAARAVLSKRQMELGVIELDIGGGTSGLAVFEEGSLIHAAVLPIGGMHVTNDIAIGLRVNVDMAETIKLEYGVCKPDIINKKEMINLDPENGSEKATNVSRKEVAEIIEARMEELFEMAEKELKKISKQALFPAGVVLTGGSAKMIGAVDFAKDYLRLPAQASAPENIEGIVDQIAGPQYATAVGLCLLGLDVEEGKAPPGLFPAGGASENNSSGALRKWFKMFLP